MGADNFESPAVLLDELRFNGRAHFTLPFRHALADRLQNAIAADFERLRAIDAAEIGRLRGEACSCPSGDGSLRWPCKAHPPESIAPAEAKGNACGCGLATCVEPWEPGCGLGTSIEHARVAPQPADGEAVEELRRALAVIGIVGTIDGHEVIRRASVLDIVERRRTTPPAAQVQGEAAITLTGYQLREALNFLAPDRDDEQLAQQVVIQWGPGRDADEEGEREGAGYYCWYDEYPEEGSIRLDETPQPGRDGLNYEPAAHPSACELGAVRVTDEMVKDAAKAIDDLHVEMTEASIGDEVATQFARTALEAALQHRGDSRGGEG